jgi:hypothetical protein
MIPAAATRESVSVDFPVTEATKEDNAKFGSQTGGISW